MRAILLGLALVTASPVAFATPNAPPTLPHTDGLDTREGKLSDARIIAAYKAYQLVVDRWKQGAARLDDVYVWSRRIRESELENEPLQHRDTDDAYLGHLIRMRELEAEVTALHRKGLASAMDVAAVTYYRSEAEFNYQDKRVM